MPLQGFSEGEESHAAIEYVMLEPGLLLVDGVRINFGMGAKIGEALESDAAYFIEFQGRVNNTQERQTIHITMDARFGFDFAGEMLDRLEQVIKLAKKQQLPPAFGGPS